MNCPNCNKPLNRIAFMGVQLDDCPDCGGIWFDADELQQLKHARANSWEDLEAKVAPRSPETTTPTSGAAKVCPKCGTSMHPYRYLFNSDVHLDECEKCGGTWVDDNELAAMSEFLQQSQQHAASSPKGQLSPDEMAKIASMPDDRINHVANALSFLSTRGRWRDPYRFEGWFEGDN